MGKFNTHGGYFAPTGYFRVDTGGSHEENPNGGVQIGVDQQGVPNMLEEDEPVYKDYVYSDNIKADADILKKYNLPSKYAGKLYSEIADSFVDEAEERPNDPVSNNGLNAMLVRLANSQEKQKQIQQQKELEEELSQMTPEELDELEAMLAQQEQGVPEEDMMQEQPRAEQPEEYPMMKCGGFIRKYGDGTPGTVVNTDAERAAAIVREALAAKLAEQEAARARQAAADSTATAHRLKRRMDREEKELGVQKRRTEAKERGVVDINPNYLESYAKGLVLQYGEQRKAEDRFNAAKKAYFDFVGEPPVQPADSVAVQIPVVQPTSQGQYEYNILSGDNDPLKACGGHIKRANKYYEGGSTIGRYAGAAYNALNALHNLAVEPDKYNWGTVKPTFINGRLALDRQKYNPIDEQRAVNDWQATQSSAYRAIANSGLGPSAQATLLAAMNNGNQGYGKALTAAREYNDRLLSNVISQNNAAAQAEANLYNRINAANAQIANQNAWQNFRMGVQQDLYNKQAETAKWDAIARALDASSIDLSNIGRENFAMNQINSNRANLGYMTGKDGLLRYLADYFKNQNA